MSQDAQLLLVAALAIVGLIALIACCKLPPFIALVLASLVVGLCSGSDPAKLTRSFAEGVGSVLGSIAMIIGLGAVAGKALEISGGAERLGQTLIEAFGTRRLPLAVTILAFVVGIPVFFGVGLVLLIPLVMSTARQNRTSFIALGLPLVTGLSVAHGLVPPHPGPIAAVGILKADLGKTILYSLLIGVPTSIVCGALLGPVLARRQTLPPIEAARPLAAQTSPRPASLLMFPLITILMPILLIFAATLADLCLPFGNGLRSAADWLGNPTIALLLAVLFSMAFLGRTQGFDMRRVATLAEQSLAPVAAILLVVGAGGGFSKVLVDNGVGDALARQVTASGISPLLAGWLIAAIIRVATGSATVAITTASGFLVPIAASTPTLNRELAVVAMGAGSLIFSHVNDGGFWLVKEYLNLTVTQTLQTWTVIETAVSVVSFLLVLLLNLAI